jgi:hypothetical protein
VKRTRRGKSIGALIQICMVTTQRNSLNSSLLSQTSKTEQEGGIGSSQRRGWVGTGRRGKVLGKEVRG